MVAVLILVAALAATAPSQADVPEPGRPRH